MDELITWLRPITRLFRRIADFGGGIASAMFPDRVGRWMREWEEERSPWWKI